MWWCCGDLRQKVMDISAPQCNCGVVWTDLYTMIITKLAGLFTLWIDVKERARSWTQYKCSRRSACHTHGASVGIYACMSVGLPLLADKENPHNSHRFSYDQSINASLFYLYERALFVYRTFGAGTCNGRLGNKLQLMRWIISLDVPIPCEIEKYRLL